MPLKFERPSPRYMRELNEVARDANELSDLISKANRLPDKFPTEAISILCMGLAALPDGTAEGSIGILTHAHSRLPSWRNEYLDFAENPNEQTDDELDKPIARRGERLDEAIKSLYASVGSAIECYKLESGSEIEADLEPETDIPIDVDIGRQPALDSVDAMGKAARDLKNQIILANPSDLEAIDTPKRILTDVDNQAKAGRSELLLQSPRPNYLKKLKSMGIASWQAIEKASGPAKSMGGIIGFGGLVAGSPEIALLGGAIGAAGHFVSLVEVAVRHLQSKVKGSQNAHVVENTIAPFDLDEVHAMILRREAPPKAWVPFIETLNFSEERKLTDLSSISELTMLKYLDIERTGVSDLSPLANLTNLEALHLNGTKVRDISNLHALSELKELNLSGLHLSDFSPLGFFTKLRYLSMCSTNIKDLSPLYGLRRLEYLLLEGTQVQSLVPIGGHILLKNLNIKSTNVVNTLAIDDLLEAGLDLEADENIRRHRKRRLW